MKKALIIIVIVALLAVNIAANTGTKVSSVHPVEFAKAVVEDMPEGIDVFKHFTEFYGGGDNETLGDKLLWLGQTTFDALSFPVTGTIWFFQACIAFWGNFDVLFTFTPTGGDHGDTEDPNYAGGR